MQADLDQVLDEKSEGMTDTQWASLEKKACSVIRGCLACYDPGGVPKAQGTKAKAKVHHS